VYFKEQSPDVWHIPSGTPYICVCMYIVTYTYIRKHFKNIEKL